KCGRASPRRWRGLPAENETPRREGSASCPRRPEGGSCRPCLALHELVAGAGKREVEFGQAVTLVSPKLQMHFAFPPVSVGMVVARLRRGADPPEKCQSGVGIREAVGLAQTAVFELPAFALLQVSPDRTALQDRRPVRVAV